MTPITPKNVWRHELIGLEVKVANSTCKSHIGLHGKVIDETKNMLIIDDGFKRRKIPKNISEFRFKLPDGCWVSIDGKILVGRPEDRVKKTIRRW
jgi:ribonuclease P protein subunit POP4